MKEWLGKRPWIWIVLFFLLYVGAWTGLIIFAVNHTPPKFDPAIHQAQLHEP